LLSGGPTGTLGGGPTGRLIGGLTGGRSTGEHGGGVADTDWMAPVTATTPAVGMTNAAVSDASLIRDLRCTIPPSTDRNPLPVVGAHSTNEFCSAPESGEETDVSGAEFSLRTHRLNGHHLPDGAQIVTHEGVVSIGALTINPLRFGSSGRTTCNPTRTRLCQTRTG
jgi:hypothetical protein